MYIYMSADWILKVMDNWMSSLFTALFFTFPSSPSLLLFLPLSPTPFLPQGGMQLPTSSMWTSLLGLDSLMSQAPLVMSLTSGR